MSDNKLISVCINAYNSEGTIKETLQSVLDQTYRNLQVIVVDDCSTDKTADIVEAMAAGDSRVELYRLPENGNISNCNNEAISHATGEYIAHLDSDDVWLDDKIEKQLAFLEKHSEYGACFTHITAVDEDGEPLGDDSYFETVFNIDNHTQAGWVRYFFDNANRICHSSMLIRKSVQDEIGLHDLSLLYLHDYDMWARLIHKYNFYILPEQLVKYRVRKGSNSERDALKDIAHNEEFARVVYNLIDNCPDKLFLEAFSDKLRYSGEHLATDTELEKAFILLDGFLSLKGNTGMGVRKFDELFKNKETVKLAKEHFGFSLRDFYNLHKEEIYFDPKLKNDYKQTKELLDKTDKELEQLKEDYKEEIYVKSSLEQTEFNNRQTIEELTQRVNALSGANSDLQSRYDILANSAAIKLTKPMRNVRSFDNIRTCLKSRRLPTGRYADAKIILFGFFGHNLGDDMFFDMLFRRYPNTLFCVAHTPDYAMLTHKYTNVRFFDISAPYYQKLNSIGSKLGIDNWSQKLLYGTADAAVHIGGSIYQQIADWQVDIAQRKQRNSQFENFFAISNNFGPYSTEDYKNFWANEFRSYSDVCFRDIYSYSLFNGIRNVRYAPDLLFSFKDEAPVAAEKRVAVSVINPRFRVRSFTEEQSRQYEEKVLELISYYVEKGYRVSLLGFCSLEEDKQEADKLYYELDYRIRENVDCVNFTDDYRVITDEIKKSETVIATRFHAMILGYVLGKKVLPICYGDKVTNVINDLSLTANPVKFEELGKFTAEQLDEKANSLEAQRIAELRGEADSQFHALDKFILSKHGTVIVP